ncbi:hypothetical protein ACFRJ9_18415 [Paenarthrobacter sp. NPDC056912]|uniref:hypothetical protein n=1 Tax=Paenarthrobacter sp. NPDC056912 TaxID=3345965 RepID=UPI00366E3B9D
MSTTTTNANTNTKPSVATATQALAEAEAKLAAHLSAQAQAEQDARSATAEQQRIEQCIANDDQTVGLDDLTKADTSLRFHNLQATAKGKAAYKAELAVRTAKSAVVMAKLDAGEYGISMDALRADAVALAKKHAKELAAHQAKCDLHNEGVRQLLDDVADTDAVTDDGTGNPASPLAWGHEDGKATNPRWVTVNEERVPVAPSYRIERVQKYTDWVSGHGEAAAEQYCQMF